MSKDAAQNKNHEEKKEEKPLKTEERTRLCLDSEGEEGGAGAGMSRGERMLEAIEEEWGA